MHRKLIPSVLAAGLLFAACSSDDDGDATTTTTAPDEETTTTIAAPSLTGLDASFGDGGTLVTPQSAGGHDRFISIVEGPDGRLYTSGFTTVGEDDRAFTVSRFDTDGTLDASFGEGGTAVINVAEGGGEAEVARGLVVGDDGTIAVAGPFEHDPSADPPDQDIAVVRLTPDGALDPSFGTAGIAKVDIGTGRPVGDEDYISDNGWGLTALDGGGYAAFASSPNPAADATDTDFAIIGLTSAGQLDPAFGTDGIARVDAPGIEASARNIHALDDGSIMATGYSHAEDGVVSPVLIRLDAQGQPDAAFGEGGVANHVILPGVTESYQFVPQDDGYLLAGYGGDDPEGTLDMVIYRFAADGSVDTSFGTDGTTRVDLAGENDRARNLTVLPDGRILVLGSGSLEADVVDTLVVLLDADGAVDETFGDGGHVLTDLGGVSDAFFGVTVIEDGSAVYLAGFLGVDPEADGNDDSALGRIQL